MMMTCSLSGRHTYVRDLLRVAKQPYRKQGTDLITRKKTTAVPFACDHIAKPSAVVLLCQVFIGEARLLRLQSVSNCSHSSPASPLKHSNTLLSADIFSIARVSTQNQSCTMSLKEMIAHWKEGVEKASKNQYTAAIEAFLGMQEPGARIYFNVASMYLRLGNLPSAEEVSHLFW